MKEKTLSVNGITVTAELAHSFISRLRGLLGRDGLDKAHGLLIYPCNQIHCFFMRFEIDAVFISSDKKVLHVISNMKRGAVSPVIHSSRYVLELNGGEADGIKEGDIFDGIL